METNNKKMIVENPLNGQKMDLMPLFIYIDGIKQYYSIDTASPSHIANVIEEIVEGQQALLTDALDYADDVSFASSSVTANAYSLIAASKLSRVFRSMSIQ